MARMIRSARDPVATAPPPAPTWTAVLASGTTVSLLSVTQILAMSRIRQPDQAARSGCQIRLGEMPRWGPAALVAGLILPYHVMTGGTIERDLPGVVTGCDQAEGPW